MAGRSDSSLLAPEERPAAEVHNPGGGGGVLLVCEHASNYVPVSLGGLGLDDVALASHVAWDIGALDLAMNLSAMFDAPLVAARISRLVYDCNRPPESADAMPASAEIYKVPGNAGLSEEARAARIREVFEPFSETLISTLDRFLHPPVLVTVHSFTPEYFGRKRAVQIGVLHDADTRLADGMLAIAGQMTDLRVGRNDPYGPDDGVTYTLHRHGVARGLANVMLEVRNDLLGDGSACRDMAELLARWLRAALGQLDATGKMTA